MAQPSTRDPSVNLQLFFEGLVQSPASAQSPASESSPGGGGEPGPASESSPGGSEEPEGLSPESSPGGGCEPGVVSGPVSNPVIDQASAALLARETSPATQLVALWLIASGGHWEGLDAESLLVRDETLSLQEFSVGVNCLSQTGLATYDRKAGVLTLSWRGLGEQAGKCEQKFSLSSSSLPSLPPSPFPPDPPIPIYQPNLPNSIALSIRKGLNPEATPCGSPQSLRPAGYGSSLKSCGFSSLSSESRVQNSEPSLINIKPEELTREELEVRVSGQPLQENLPGVSRAKPPELRRARKKSHPLYEQTRKLVVLWAARSGRKEDEEAKRVTPFRMKLVRERLAEGYDWPALARAVSGVAYSPWRKTNGADQIENALKAGKVDQAIAEWERFAPIQKVLEYSEQYGRVPPSRAKELEEYRAQKNIEKRRRREGRRAQREIEELRAQRTLEAQEKAAREAWEREFFAEELAEAEEERKREQLAAISATTEDQGTTDDQ